MRHATICFLVRKQPKRKLKSDAKEVETQDKTDDINFTTPPRPYKLLKCSENSGLEANPSTSSSCSSTIKIKNDMSMVSYEKPSPDEKKSL